MLFVPMATALALGILLAAWAWDAGGPRCDIALFPFLHAHPGLSIATAALPLLLLPLGHKWRNTPHLRPLGLMLYVALGSVLYLARPFTPCLPDTHIARLAEQVDGGKTVVVTGVIVGWPETRARKVHYRLRVESVRDGGHTSPAWGDVLVYAPRYPAFRYGDRVRVVGILGRPPVFEDFDYRRYLARQGIHATLRAQRITPLDAGHGALLWRGLYALRARASTVINATLPEPYAALTNGILLGIESNIPRSLYADFNATGTSHIIVISGFNIAIVAGLFLALLTPLLGRRRAGVLAVGGIGLYVLLVGADAAVVRAGIMGGILAAAQVFGRRAHALNSLFASAFIMLSLNPLTLWDVGFQLSFLATLGLIVILPALQHPFRRALSRLVPDAWEGRAFDLLNEALIVTTAAQATTTPLIMATFSRFSFVSLLTNALILPVQPLVMMGAGISTAVGLVWLPLGRVLALVPLLPLTWTVEVVRVTAGWPGAGATAPGWVRPLALVYYGGLAAVVVMKYRSLGGKPSLPPPLSTARARGGKVLASLRPGPNARWRLVALALLPLSLVVLAAPPAVPSFVLLPGGSLRVELPAGVDLLFPADKMKGESPASLSESIRPRRSTVWVLTQVDTRTLAGLRLLLQTETPSLVITPALCQRAGTCPAPFRAFLQSLDVWGVPRTASGPGAWWRAGEVWGMYLPLKDTKQSVYPVVVRGPGLAILFPFTLASDVQGQVAAALPGERVPLVLPLPLPESGTWPNPQALAILRPALLLYPEGATYPPASVRALRAYPVHRYDPDEGIRLQVGEGGEIMILSGPR